MQVGRVAVDQLGQLPVDARHGVDRVGSVPSLRSLNAVKQQRRVYHTDVSNIVVESETAEVCAGFCQVALEVRRELRASPVCEVGLVLTASVSDVARHGGDDNDRSTRGSK